MSVWEHSYKVSKAEPPPPPIQCRCCGERKSPQDFFFNKRDKKHIPYCRVCDAAKRRAKRARNKEQAHG